MLYNKILADINIYNSNIRTLHYNVEGKSFMTYHRLFQEFYEETTEHIDDIAEMIATMGKTPVSTFKSFLEVGTLAEISEEPISEMKAVEKLLKNTEHMASHCRTVIQENEEDYVAVDFYTTLLATYEKRIWILRQSLKG